MIIKSGKIHNKRNIQLTVIGTDHGGQSSMGGGDISGAKEQTDKIYNCVRQNQFRYIYVEFLDDSIENRINNMVKQYNDYSGSELVYSNLPPIKIAISRLIDNNMIKYNMIKPIDNKKMRSIGDPVSNNKDSDVLVRDVNGNELDNDDINEMKDMFSKKSRSSYMTSAINEHIVKEDLQNCNILVLCGQNHVDDILSLM